MNSIVSEQFSNSNNFYKIISPENRKVKSSLLILHGMKEHCGRYLHFANYLSNQGIAVLIFDHIGHGNTVKSEAELGFFKKNDSVAQLLNDAARMSKILKSAYPNIPHFILGHSMGSFITRNLLREQSNQFDGAIIVGTGGKVFGIYMTQFLFKILNSIAPKYKSKFINASFDVINNSRFAKEKPSDGTNWLSVNMENRQNFIQDPLCGVDFSFNGFYTLFSLVNWATKKNWAKNIDKNYPLLFVSGNQDPIGNFGKGVLKTVNDLKNDGFRNVSVKLYENMRHEILNENIKEEVYGNVLKWMSSQSIAAVNSK